MIEVNISELKTIIDNLKSLIDEYEEIQLNLFNQIKNSCNNWQDGNSLIFEEKINLEKQETTTLFQELIHKKELYDFIYNKYSELGKKIKCNLNNKTTLLHAIDECYNQAINIINEFWRIDRSFYYHEMHLISTQNQVIVNVKNKLAEIKNDAIKMYNKIEETEKEINKKIKELEQTRINNFDFNLN